MLDVPADAILRRAPLRHRLRRRNPLRGRVLARDLLDGDPISDLDGQGDPELQHPIELPPGLVSAATIGARQLFDAGRRFQGEPYSTGGGRTSVSSGYKDCSGFIYAAHTAAGRTYPGGGTVSTAQETGAINAGGAYVKREWALTKPAVMCFIWGFGPQGHVEWTAGDGVNTYGTPADIAPNYRRVGYSHHTGNRWTAFVALPDVLYEGDVAPPAEQPFIEGDDMITVYTISDGAGHKLWKRDGITITPILQGHANGLTGSGLGRGVVIAVKTQAEHFAEWDQLKASWGPTPVGAGAEVAPDTPELAGFDASELENAELRAALGA